MAAISDAVKFASLVEAITNVSISPSSDETSPMAWSATVSIESVRWLLVSDVSTALNSNFISSSAIIPAGSSFPALIRLPVVNCLIVVACAAAFLLRMLSN